MIELLSTIPYPQFSPEILRLGPIAVRWYGVAYLCAFVGAYLWLQHMAKTGLLRMKAQEVGDLILWLAFGVILGGRAGWWIFYHRSTGAPEPWFEPVAIWHGGMSFHGGLAGVAAVLAIWSMVYKLPVRNLLDCAALVTPVGLFFGRIANFINAELWGRPSDVPWAMVFPTDPDRLARHPSQLYEALLEGPILLTALWTYKKLVRPNEGVIAGLFLVLYGLFRFGVEFTREPDPQLGFIAFGWLTMGQLLSAALVVIGLVLMLRSKK